MGTGAIVSEAKFTITVDERILKKGNLEFKEEAKLKDIYPLVETLLGSNSFKVTVPLGETVTEQDIANLFDGVGEVSVTNEGQSFDSNTPGTYEFSVLDPGEEGSSERPQGKGKVTVIVEEQSDLEQETPSLSSATSELSKFEDSYFFDNDVINTLISIFDANGANQEIPNDSLPGELLNVGLNDGFEAKFKILSKKPYNSGLDIELEIINLNDSNDTGAKKIEIIRDI